MKKYFILMFSISFLFFSCASTNIEDSKTEDLNSQDGKIETVEQTHENQTDFPSEDITSENITNEEVSDETENLISEQYPKLEEIVEPEITDLEWTSETEENQEVPQEKNDENTEETLEEIPEDDILTPTEETFTENLQPEEAQSDSQEITENEESNNDESSLENNDENFSEEDEIIDISEDNNFDIVEEIDEVNENNENGNFENEKNIIPSRKISLKIGQTLEVEYPGSGWIFMGATDNSKDFTFLGKKLGTENTKFSFKAKNAGNKILHFYKNDILSQNYIDDYLEVEILNEKDSSAKTISAPEYKQQIITKNQQNNEENFLETKIEQTQTSENNDFENNSIEKTNGEELIFDETSNNENKTSLSEDEIKSLLIEAKNLFDEKKYQESLSKLNLFIEFSNENRDEALFLQGQIYESNSDYKNIKKALESYKNLTKNYPASSYWDSANKRIIYLTKFYLEGR